MATDFMSKIVEGPIDTAAEVVEMVAAGPIALWSPVILAAPGTDEDMPRVDTVNAITGKVHGVVVGPLLPSGMAADAAGDKVNVCIKGWCKVRVDGVAAAIAVGDYLISHAAVSGVGVAQKAAATGFPFAQAGHASTVDLDIIPACVGVAATVVA